MPLAAAKALVDVPYWAAMPDKVSPGRTWTVVLQLTLLDAAEAGAAPGGGSCMLVKFTTAPL